MRVFPKSSSSGDEYDKNDPASTVSNAAKKVMTSFRKKQTQWEETLRPIGNSVKKKISHNPIKRNFSHDVTRAPLSPTRRNHMTQQRRTSKSTSELHHHNAPESVARAAAIMPQVNESELDDLPMASAKPSAIRAAAKHKRIATQKETQKARERQRKAAEQQMKMQKYRDEIAAIKSKQEEARNDLKRSNHGHGHRSKKKNTIADQAVRKILTKDVTAKEEHAVLGYKEEDFASNDFSLDVDGGGGSSSLELAPPNIEEKLSPVPNLDKTKRSRKMRVMREMKGSFRQLDISSHHEPPEKPSTPHEKVSISSMSLSLEPPRQREYNADKQGRLRQAPRRRSSAAAGGAPVMVGGNFKKRDGGPPPRQSSINLVPEMRRRPNQRDLLFDEADVKLTKNMIVDGEMITTSEREANYKGTKWNKTKLIESKQEKEKKAAEEQKTKLDEAEEAFKKGHNLCWQIHDSASALGEYRTALFIRESLLGKYHEQTGRTYFWIGKSLVKLGEYSEALVAFSRSLRIFERVVRKAHKYYKWTVLAIEECVEKMEDPTFSVEAYKARLYDSIRFEREGDAFRKRGNMAEAVAKYRDAIDHVEEYHPDAADLYSKIALILRQDGDFERALEEYRFASEIYEMSLGADHPETVKALNEVMEKKRLGQLSNMLKNKLNLKL